MKLGTLFLFVLAAIWSHETRVFADQVDLDLIALVHARKMAADCGKDVRWHDIYGKQSHLQNKYPDKKLSINTDNVIYGTTSRKVDRPGFVYTQWFHNGGSLPITGILAKEKTVENTFTWSVSESLKVGFEISVDAGIPEIISGNVKIMGEINLASTQGKTETEKDTFKVSHVVKIPPHSKVKATMTITETEVEVPWTADVYVTGWEAVWMEPQCRGHWLWFYPADWLAPYDGRLKAGSTPHGQGFTFKSKGLFKGVHAIRATVRTEEFPLD